MSYSPAWPHCPPAFSQYLYDPVLGLQACPLSWRVFIHSSDVLARPCPLTVQVEAISAGASLDHAETGPQFSARLLEEATGEKRETSGI